MTIGERAYKAIKEKASKKGISFARECAEIGFSNRAAIYWVRGNAVPGGYILSLMLKNGYDLNYILLGEET